MLLSSALVSGETKINLFLTTCSWIYQSWAQYVFHEKNKIIVVVHLFYKFSAGLSNDFIEQRTASLYVFCCRDVYLRWWLSLTNQSSGLYSKSQFRICSTHLELRVSGHSLCDTNSLNHIISWNGKAPSQSHNNLSWRSLNVLSLSFSQEFFPR